MQTGHREVNVVLWDFGHTLYSPHNTEIVNRNITRTMQLYGILDKPCIHNTKGSLLGHRGSMGVLTNAIYTIQRGHRRVIVALWDFGYTLNTTQYKSHHEVTVALWDFGQTVYTHFKGVIVRSLQLCGILDTIQKGPHKSL